MIEYVLAATLFYVAGIPGQVGGQPAETEFPEQTGSRTFDTLDKCNAYWKQLIVNQGPKYRPRGAQFVFRRIEGTVCEPREKVAEARDPRLDAADAAIAETLAKQKR